MTYLGCWLAGGVAGSVAALLVLWWRGALRPVPVTALGLAWLGFLYGAKLQFRLPYVPLREALVLPPGQLLAPGFHVPLGFLVAWAIATAWCLALRGPWRETGDALAVAGGIMIPIGRIGCLLEGCCGGVRCPAWLPFGVRAAPGSSAYVQQVASGLLPPDSPLSLPVHPLPVYFALAALIAVGIAIGLLVRGARPGVPLVAFALVWASAQLVLEPLRADTSPRTAAFMTAVLLAMLGFGLVLAADLVRRGADAPLPGGVRT